MTDVQPTPNPNAMKFVLDRQLTEQPVSFLSRDALVNLVDVDSVQRPGGLPLGVLAKRLFDISGVSSVLMLGDFVTVNKQPQAKWPPLTKAVKVVLETFDHAGA